MCFSTQKSRNISNTLEAQIATTKFQNSFAQEDVFGVGTVFLSNLTVHPGSTPPPRSTNAGGDSDRNGRYSSPRSRVSFEAGVDQEEDYQTSKPNRSRKSPTSGNSRWKPLDDPSRQEQIVQDEIKARRKAWEIATDLDYVDGPFEDKCPTFLKKLTTAHKQLACARTKFSWQLKDIANTLMTAVHLIT